MEVSESKWSGALEPMADEMLKGAQLLEAVVSLSGLEHSDAQDQLMRILDGQSSAQATVAADSLTLDQLRAAMLDYLEQMNADYAASAATEAAPVQGATAEPTLF